MGLPKTIYFYWGSETMSFLRYMTFFTFRAHNPDWNMVLVKRKNPLPPQSYNWDEEQDFMLTPLPDYSENLGELGIEIQYLEEEFPFIASMDISDVHTSDILAWAILALKGGVVSDTDIIFVRSFDYERFQNAEFGICCFERFPKPNYMPVSFMLSQPNLAHERIFNASLKNVNKSVYESAGTVVIEGEYGTFESIKSSHPEINIVKLPSKIVFPFAEDYPWGLYSQLAFNQNRFNLLHDSCVGIHWYAGAPGHQAINKAYSDGNFSKFNNTVSSAIYYAQRKMSK